MTEGPDFGWWSCGLLVLGFVVFAILAALGFLGAP